MKICYSVIFLGLLSTTALGAAIVRPQSGPSEMTVADSTAPTSVPTGAVSSGLMPVVRRQNTSAPGATGGGNGGGPFVPYSGPASNFPDPKEWASFTSLWNQNVGQMKAAGNSDAENGFMMQGIFTVASSSGVDSRAILATIMQESTGNVRVTSTDNGVGNPGLMQSHAGVSFNPADPQGSIVQMIRDGTEGTASGDGLKQTLAAQNGNIYEAFRKYNSGSVDTADLNDPVGATSLYVQEMANRLMGATSVTA